MNPFVFVGFKTFVIFLTLIDWFKIAVFKLYNQYHLSKVGFIFVSPSLWMNNEHWCIVHCPLSYPLESGSVKFGTKFRPTYLGFLKEQDIFKCVQQITQWHCNYFLQKSNDDQIFTDRLMEQVDHIPDAQWNKESLQQKNVSHLSSSLSLRIRFYK